MKLELVCLVGWVVIVGATIRYSKVGYIRTQNHMGGDGRATVHCSPEQKHHISILNTWRCEWETCRWIRTGTKFRFDMRGLLLLNFAASKPPLQAAAVLPLPRAGTATEDEVAAFFPTTSPGSGPRVRVMCCALSPRPSKASFWTSRHYTL